MAKLGNLWFDLGLDTRQLDKAWGEAMKKYQAQGKFDTNLGSKKTLDGINAQNSALGIQKRLMQNLHTLAGSYISIFAAGRLVRELITVSGEFEMQRVSLQAILKDLYGANKIFDQIKQLSVKSPFQFKDLISYTKQLSAFSIPMGELYDTTKMLSDVSAGLGVGMDRLVLAYGQIRAASVLRGQEVRQLTEAGIPVIEELRKKFEALGETGITAADVFDKISARLVPFSMIKEMFEDMTSAGGKFYKMQEIQAETLKGKVSNLKDAYQIMFSEIGEKGDGILKGGVDTLRFLISNYEDVGKTILELTLAYGAYKAVVLSLTAVEKARYSATLMMGAAEKTITTWQGLRVAMTNALTAAQERLNIAMAKNPYLLAGVAVAALGYGIYKLISYQTDLEKSLEKLEESYAKTSAETGVQVKELDRLYARLQLAKEGSAEYLKARNDIERTFGDTLSGLKNEKGGVLDLADAYEVLKTKIIETAQERGYEKAMEGAKEDLAKGIEKQLKGLYDALDRTTKLSSYEKERLKEALTPVLWGTRDFESLDTETKRLFNSLTEAKAKFGGGAYDKNPLQTYLDTSNRLQDSFDKTEQTAQKMFKTIGGETGGEMWPPKPEWLNASDWEQELTKYALTLNKFGELVTRKGDESIEDFLSRLREDYANTSDLISSRSKLAGEDVSGLKERLAVLSGAFKILGISPIEAKEGKVKPEKEQRDYRADLIELEKKLALDLAKARIDGMVEGFDKEMAQMDYEHQRRIEQIERQKRDLLEMQKKAGGSGEQLTPENAALVGGLVSSEVNRYNTQTNQFYKAQLDKYRTYQEQRNDVDEWYTKEQEALLESSASISAAQLESKLEVMAKTYKDKMKEINDAETSQLMKHSTLLMRIFGENINLNKKRLKETIRLGKQLVQYALGASDLLPEGITPEYANKLKNNTETVTKLITSLEEMEQKSFTEYPLSGFIEGFKKLAEAAKYAKTDTEGLDDAQKALLETQEASAREMAASLMIEGAQQLADLLTFAADSMQKLAEASGDTKLKEFADQASAFADLASATAKGASQGGWIGAIIGAATSVITQTIDAFAVATAEEAEYQQNQLDYLNEYHNMLLKIKAEDYESIFGVEVFRRSADAIRNARQALKAFNDELYKRTTPEIEKESWSKGFTAFTSTQGLSNLYQVTTKESKLAMAAYKKGYTDLERMAIKTKDHSGWANFLGKKDEFKTLFDIAPEIWGGKLGGEFNVNAAKVFLETNTQITEEQRKQIQNLITQKELYDENVNIIKEDLKDTFGGMGDAMVDSIVRAMTEGADSWELFKDAGELAIEKLGEKLMYELFFAKRFKKYGEDLMAVYDDETLTPEEIAAEQLRITDEYMGVFQQDQEAAKKWAEMYKESAKERGYDVWDSADSNSLGKSIQAAQMTENTANLIASYINAIRADGSKKSMMMEKITPMVGNINDTLSNSLTHLAAINSNTLRSANGVDRLVEKIDALTTPNGATRLNTVVRTS